MVAFSTLRLLCVVFTLILSPLILSPMALAGPSMRFVLVKAEGPCGAACPEWISAEGKIVAETPAAFNALLRTLGKRRPPILLHSPGGHVEAAVEIGRTLRRLGFDTAVGRTRFEGCYPGQPDCPMPVPGKSMAGRPLEGYNSVCSSACVILLAAGKKRVMLGRAFVGVHQLKVTRPEQSVQRYRIHYRIEDGRRVEVRREVIGSVRVEREEFVATAKDKRYVQLARYFVQMGVGAELIDLFHLAPPEKMHWVSAADLGKTRLVGLWQGPREFLGLPLAQQTSAQASVFRPETFTALGKADLRLAPQNPHDARLEIEFTLHDQSRQVRLSVLPVIDGQNFRGTSSVLLEMEDGKAYLALRPEGSRTMPMRSTIPQAAFCQLRRDRPVRITFEAQGEDRRETIFIRRDPQPISISGLDATKLCAAVP